MEEITIVGLIYRKDNPNGGYPHPGCRYEYPIHPHGGYPIQADGDTPARSLWGTPRPSGLASGTVPAGQDGVPPPGRQSSRESTSTRRGVCLLYSRRRTFLLYINENLFCARNSLWKFLPSHLLSK